MKTVGKWKIDKEFRFTSDTKSQARIDALYKMSRLANGPYSWQYDFKIEEKKNSYIVMSRVKPHLQKIIDKSKGRSHAKVINGVWRADPADMAEREKPWSVSAGHGKTYYCDTLEEAKRIGENLARQNSWKNKWNCLWANVSIYKTLSPGYVKLYLFMPVPVRGTGTRYETILETMKKREMTPYQWRKA